MCEGIWTRWPAFGATFPRRAALGKARVGIRRGFNGVDVVVIRAGVIRIATQHTFEHGDDLERPSGAGLPSCVQSFHGRRFIMLSA